MPACRPGACECCLRDSSHVVTCSRSHVVCVECSARAGASGECFYCDPSKSQSSSASHAANHTAASHAANHTAASHTARADLRTSLGATLCTAALNCCAVGALIAFFLLLGAIFCKFCVTAGVSLANDGAGPPRWALRRPVGASLGAGGDRDRSHCVDCI